MKKMESVKLKKADVIEIKNALRDTGVIKYNEVIDKKSIKSAVLSLKMNSKIEDTEKIGFAEKRLIVDELISCKFMKMPVNPLTVRDYDGAIEEIDDEFGSLMGMYILNLASRSSIYRYSDMYMGNNDFEVNEETEIDEEIEIDEISCKDDEISGHTKEQEKWLEFFQRFEDAGLMSVETILDYVHICKNGVLINRRATPPSVKGI